MGVVCVMILLEKIHLHPQIPRPVFPLVEGSCELPKPLQQQPDFVLRLGARDYSLRFIGIRTLRSALIHCRGHVVIGLPGDDRGVAVRSSRVQPRIDLSVGPSRGVATVDVVAGNPGVSICPGKRNTVLCRRDAYSTQTLGRSIRPIAADGEDTTGAAGSLRCERHGDRHALSGCNRYREGNPG